MDNRKFDSIARSLASGTSRRSVLKGLFGLGGAALVGTVGLDQQADAARRPTPTPKPVTCPGRQTWNGAVCVCPGDATNKCGPDCCTGTTTDPYPRVPGHSECCDNACCFGTCYGEELCCPTNSTGPESPPTHELCEDNTCVDLTDGGCCDDGDCGGDPCQICNLETHTCGPRCNAATEVCCAEQAGAGICQVGSCCPGAPCEEGGCYACTQDESGSASCTYQCDESESCCGTGANASCEACCNDSDCGDPCLTCNLETHTCDALCGEGSTCCTEQAGAGICQLGSCCPGAPCGEDGCSVCRINESGSASCEGCGEGSTCCADGEGVNFCQAGTCCPGGAGCSGDTPHCCGGETKACCASECDPTTGLCPSACAPNCDCSDPANDGLDCNGGLAAGGGVCACGYCVVPLDGCPCGCVGDTECVRCAGDGVCENYNQGENCNGGAGICDGPWCVSCPEDAVCGEECCTNGTSCCGDICTNLGTNENCASCDDVCSEGTECQTGPSGGYACISTCKAEGDACDDSSDCCSAAPHCPDGLCVKCIPINQTGCSSSGDCCGGLFCETSSGTCYQQ